MENIIPKVDRRYYIATETKEFSSNLNAILTHSVWRQEASSHAKNGKLVSALFVGNSYILNAIALLPEEIFNVIDFCDYDPVVINYTKNLIACAKEAESYDAFKAKLKIMNEVIVHEASKEEQQQHILNYSRYGYNYDDWVEERFLSARNFDLFKRKIDRFNIKYHEGDIMKVKFDNKVFKLLSLSNLHNFIDNKKGVVDPLQILSPLFQRLKLSSQVGILYSSQPPRKTDVEPRMISQFTLIDFPKETIITRLEAYRKAREADSREYYSFWSKYFAPNTQSRTAKLASVTAIIEDLLNHNFNPKNLPAAAKSGTLAKIIKL